MKQAEVQFGRLSEVHFLVGASHLTVVPTEDGATYGSLTVQGPHTILHDSEAAHITITPSDGLEYYGDEPVAYHEIEEAGQDGSAEAMKPQVTLRYPASWGDVSRVELEALAGDITVGAGISVGTLITNSLYGSSVADGVHATLLRMSTTCGNIRVKDTAVEDSATIVSLQGKVALEGTSRAVHGWHIRKTAGRVTVAETVEGDVLLEE